MPEISYLDRKLEAHMQQLTKLYERRRLLNIIIRDAPEQLEYVNRKIKREMKVYDKIERQYDEQVNSDILKELRK